MLSIAVPVSLGNGGVEQSLIAVALYCKCLHALVIPKCAREQVLAYKSQVMIFELCV